MLFSCGRSAEEERQLKTLDSLNGALATKLQELRSMDTVLMKRALRKFENYRQFIQQNVQDTLEKEEADRLQQFYMCGKNLEDIQENRRTVLGRGELISAQLTKLMQDIRNGAADNEKLSLYLFTERKGAEELIRGTYGQQQAFITAVESFKLAVPGVEDVMKKRNNGELPVIIKDSVPF